MPKSSTKKSSKKGKGSKSKGNHNRVIKKNNLSYILNKYPLSGKRQSPKIQTYKLKDKINKSKRRSSQAGGVRRRSTRRY